MEINFVQDKLVRLVIGGIIATIILFVTDGVFHENVVAADWKAGSKRTNESV
jgi:hypothetical protein